MANRNSRVFNFASMVPRPEYMQSRSGPYIDDQYTPVLNARNQATYGTALQKAGMAQKLADDYQNKYDEAKGANESRYKEILQGFGSIGTDINSAFAGLSKQQQDDVAMATRNAKAGNTQAMVQAGMNGTTILPSLNMQADKNSAAALNRINDTIAMAKLGYTTQNSKDKLGFMERREDTYPDATMFAELIKQFGNYSDVQYSYR